MKLIDKDAVLEIIHNHEPLMDDLACIEIKMLINALPISTDEWVSVRERLPEDGDDVLVMDGNVRCVAIYSDPKHLKRQKHQCWFIEGVGEWVDSVTHWQPLPQPPTK
jgi:uncharacterized protein DUF551